MGNSLRNHNKKLPDFTVAVCHSASDTSHCTQPETSTVAAYMQIFLILVGTYR